MIIQEVHLIIAGEQHLSNTVQQAVQVQEAGKCGVWSLDEATTCNSNHGCDGGSPAESPLAKSHRPPLL